MNIVSGVRSVLPVLHKETGEEKVVDTLKILLKGIQMVKGKRNMHHLSIKAPAKSKEFGTQFHGNLRQSK